MDEGRGAANPVSGPGIPGFLHSKVMISNMDQNGEKDQARRENLFEFVRRAFQCGGGSAPADREEPGGGKPALSEDDPKAKARLEDGACRAEGE